MARTGRNDPCPCGSGVKFKNCCGDGDKQTEQTTEARTTVHVMDNALTVAMLDFAAKNFGPQMKGAMNAFLAPQDRGNPLLRTFLDRYWLHHVEVKDGLTVRDEFLRKRVLHARERAWLLAHQQAWLGLWEILEVAAGHRRLP